MDWDTPIGLLKSRETGDFVRTIAIPPGMHQARVRCRGQLMIAPLSWLASLQASHMRYIWCSVQVPG